MCHFTSDVNGCMLCLEKRCLICINFPLIWKLHGNCGDIYITTATCSSESSFHFIETGYRSFSVSHFFLCKSLGVNFVDSVGLIC